MSETDTSTPFGALRQVDAGLLNVGYAEAGPAAGPAVIPLHGRPYDIHSFADVTPLLAAAGYRVIGTSTTQPSRAARPPSTTPITWLS